MTIRWPFINVFLNSILTVFNHCLNAVRIPLECRYNNIRRILIFNFGKEFIYLFLY